VAPAAAQPPQTEVVPLTSLTQEAAPHEGALDDAIRRYLVAGYSLTSRTRDMAIVEYREPFRVALFIVLLLLFWPLALICFLPGVRKYHRAVLTVGANGRVVEQGSSSRRRVARAGTTQRAPNPPLPSEAEAARRRKNQSVLLILAIGLLTFCFLIGMVQMLMTAYSM
jgi:hypothetical protein